MTDEKMGRYAMATAMLMTAVAPVQAGVANSSSADGRWIADQGDGTYRNPVIDGDYSDLDVTRVGDTFYMVASSFSDVPGLPLLESTDLVNWHLVGHAITVLDPEAHYSVPRRGGGVWAPSIRFHEGLFRIFYADPDRGIFQVSAPDVRGPWSKPQLVDATPGAIDPAPFRDEDGRAWLVHAFAKSRAGKANIIMLKPMDAEGAHVIGPGQPIIEGDKMPPAMTSLGSRPWQTTEGPKLYKRDGWYYVFVPSGSVKGGWQGVFRSRTITGPYEGRDVLDQGGTDVNGPHQGAWVTTSRGEDWFLHFQDRDSWGRVVHLEPMIWRNGWPVIGEDADGIGRGTPVLRHRKPAGSDGPPDAPVADDEFEQRLSPAWQFGSNPAADWARIVDGRLRLKAVTGSGDLYEVGDILSQKLPSDRFSATTRLCFRPERDGERAGLTLHGTNFAWIGLERSGGQVRIVRYEKSDAEPGAPIFKVEGPAAPGAVVWLRVTVHPQTVTVPPPDFRPYWPSMERERRAIAQFSYSLDGRRFAPLGATFAGLPGKWVGAQVGLFDQAELGTPAATATTVGYSDFDWFRVTP